MARNILQMLKNNRPLILLWITLTSTAPFIFYSWPGHPYKLLTFAGLLFMTIAIFMKSDREMFDFKIFSIIILQICYYVFASFYHNDFSNLNLCVQLISLFIIVTYINGFIGFEKFVKSYIYVILAMAIGGTFIFFAHLLIGVKPLFEVQYSESGTSYFLWLTTSNVYFDVSNIRLIRYSGFFDEPGTFALFSFFAIILNKIYFENKRIELWLIILTVFTLSIAFYVSMIVYFMFFYLTRSNLRNIVIIIAVLSVASFYIIKNKEDESIGKLYEFTFKRFEVNDSGLTGDNRVELSMHDKKVFYEYPILGAGSTKMEIYGSNLFAVFAQYGIVGSLFYYAFLVYFVLQIIMMNNKNRYFYFRILILILINFYSRPELSSVFTLLIFVSIIYHIRSDSMLQKYLIINEENNRNEIKIS